MFAVIFEVIPKPEQWDAYLGYAKQLRPELEKIEGFIENERFASKRRKGWLLSLSTWKDEKAVVRWRTHAGHHGVQEKGRFEVFRDYHLRVGEVTGDSRLPAGERLPTQRLDETEAGAARLVALTERALGTLPENTDPAEIARRIGLPEAQGRVDWDVFENINRASSFILLTSWRKAEDAASWQPADDGIRHRTVRIVRDYGMRQRQEAPQYYPPVAG